MEMVFAQPPPNKFPSKVSGLQDCISAFSLVALAFDRTWLASIRISLHQESPWCSFSQLQLQVYQPIICHNPEMSLTDRRRRPHRL